MYCHSLWRRRRREEGSGGEEEGVGREEKGRGGEEGKGRGGEEGAKQYGQEGGVLLNKAQSRCPHKEGLFPAHTTTTEMHTTNTLIHRKPFLVSECKQVHRDHYNAFTNQKIHQSNCSNSVINLQINNFLSHDSLALETGVSDEAALRLIQQW